MTQWQPPANLGREEETSRKFKVLSIKTLYLFCLLENAPHIEFCLVQLGALIHFTLIPIFYLKIS